MSQLALATDVDTTASSLCLATQPTEWIAAGQPDSCFIVGSTITISGTVTAHGTRPLVLVATDTIEVDALLDVASHRGGSDGPGDPSSLCKAFLLAPGNGSGGGGGAGGTFMTEGGDGGKGNNGNVAHGSGSAPGAAPSCCAVDARASIAEAGLAILREVAAVLFTSSRRIRSR